MSIKDRIATGVKALLVSKVVWAAANGLLLLLLTRFLLTPEEFGLFRFALSVLGVVVIFGGLGLPKSTAKYVTEYVEKDPSQVRYILRRSALYLVVLATAVSVLVAVTSTRVADLLGEPRLAAFLVVGSLYVAFYTFHGFLGAVFQGFNRVTYNAILRVVTGVSRVVFVVGFVLAGLGAIGALLGYAAGFVVAAVVGTVVMYRRFYSQYEATTDPESGLSRRILRYSVPLTATRGANVLDRKVDAILVGVLLNPTAVGLYVIAKQVTEVVAMPATSIGFTISPILGEQKASDRERVAKDLYQESLVYVLLFYVPAAVGLILVAHPIVDNVFGNEYAGAAPVLQVMAVYVVVEAINQITSDGLDYLGRANARAVAKTTMAVANFGLNLLLIPALGVVGAAVATVFTYGTYTLINVYTIHSELTLDVREILGQTAKVCAIATLVAGAVLATMPLVSGLFSLLAVVAFGGLVWAALGVVSGMVDLERVESVLH